MMTSFTTKLAGGGGGFSVQQRTEVIALLHPIMLDFFGNWRGRLFLM